MIHVTPSVINFAISIQLRIFLLDVSVHTQVTSDTVGQLMSLALFNQAVTQRAELCI